MSASQSELL